MRVLIDGYNYLHAVGRLRPRSADHAGPHELERARQALLSQLAACYAPDESVTVVFDAAGAPPDVPAEDRYHHVRVLNDRRSADDRIEELIRHDSAPRSLTVVSDDRRIRHAAERRGCVVLACAAFEVEMERHHRRRVLQERAAPEKPDGVSEREKAELERVFGEAVDDADPPEA